MKPLCVGTVPSRNPGADAYVVVWDDDTPHLRIDAFSSIRGGPFSACICWGRFVLLGWCDVVHAINLTTQQIADIPCDDYFESFKPIDGEKLLIATSARLICIDDGGGVISRTEPLGIDGVVVNRISDAGIIEGEGEWDPPDGWRPFRVFKRDGRILDTR